MRTIAKYSHDVIYNIKTNLDSSGIAKLQNELSKVINGLNRKLGDSRIMKDPGGIKQTVKDLTDLKQMLNSSLNPKTGFLDLTSFNKQLTDKGKSLQDYQNMLGQLGPKGQAAFNSLYGEVTKLDTGVKNLSAATQKMWNTIGNTVRWGVVSMAFQGLLTNVHQAATYIKDLDKSLTNIMMVTDNSREQMKDFASYANDAARALGSTTVAYTDATTIFAQQGFSLDESKNYADLSIKLANASGQSTKETSNQITAYMNAYGLDQDMEGLTSALDSWAEVANISAADVKELATASQKSASTAATVGVSTDQLNASIATIESVTRDAPENIGNSLKTIYARFSDIKLGETLDDGVTLGQVTGTLEKVGVSALDEGGNLRSVGDIMEDLMVVWEDLDMTTKAAVGSTLAGKYQLTRFEALMNRSDLYNQYKEGSMNADGTLDQMNEEYLTSIEARLNQLKTSVEKLLTDLYQSADFASLISGLTTFVDMIGKAVDSIGGMGTALAALIPIFGKLFAGNIGRTINRIADNFRVAKSQQANLAEQRVFAQQQLTQRGISTTDKSSQQYMQGVARMNQHAPMLSNEDRVIANDLGAKFLQATNDEVLARGRVAASEDNLKRVSNLLGVTPDELKQVYSDKDVQTQWRETANKAGTNLSNFSSAGTALIAGLKDGSLDDRAINQRLKGMRTIASKGIGLSDDAMSTLGTLNANMGKDKLLNALNTVAKDTEGAARVLDSARNLPQTMTSHREVEQAHGMAENQRQIVSKAVGDQAKQFDQQAKISNVVRTTAAVGELAMAWMSFQALGSLWKNEDLSLGEKILQTVMNLAFSLPMLGSAAASLTGTMQNAFGSVGAAVGSATLLGAADSLDEAAAGGVIATADVDSDKQNKGAGTGAVATETKKQQNKKKSFSNNPKNRKKHKKGKILDNTKVGPSSDPAAGAALAAADENKKSPAKAAKAGTLGKGAVAGFAGLLTSIGPMLIGLTAIVAGLAAFSSILSEIEAERKEKIDRAKEIKEESEEQEKAAKSFETALSSYKKGTGAIEDVTSAMEDMNGVLDDQALKIYSASGNLDAYAARLKTVMQLEREKQRLEVLDGFEALSHDDANTNTWTWEDLVQSLVSTAGNERVNQGPYSNDENSLKVYRDSNANLELLLQERVSLNDALAEARRKGDEETVDFYEKELKSTEDEINKQQELNESSKEEAASLKKLIDSAVQLDMSEVLAEGNQEVFGLTYEAGQVTGDVLQQIREKSSTYKEILNSANGGYEAAEEYAREMLNQYATSDLEGAEELLAQQANETVTFENELAHTIGNVELDSTGKVLSSKPVTAEEVLGDSLSFIEDSFNAEDAFSTQQDYDKAITALNKAIESGKLDSKEIETAKEKIASLEEVSLRLSEATRKVNERNQEASQGFSEVASKIGGMKDLLSEYKNLGEDISKQNFLEDHAEEIDDYAKSLSKLMGFSEDFGKELLLNEKAMGGFNKMVKAGSKDAKLFSEGLEEVEEGAKQVTKASLDKSFETNFDDADTSAEKYSQTMKELGQNSDFVTEAFEELNITEENFSAETLTNAAINLMEAIPDGAAIDDKTAELLAAIQLAFVAVEGELGTFENLAAAHQITLPPVDTSQFTSSISEVETAEIRAEKGEPATVGTDGGSIVFPKVDTNGLTGGVVTERIPSAKITYTGVKFTASGGAAGSSKSNSGTKVKANKTGAQAAALDSIKQAVKSSYNPADIGKAEGNKDTSPGTSPGPGGGGGGGGGGGNDSKIEDETEKALDIYQEVNESLERISAAYDKIDGITDRLYGADKVNNIRKAAEEEEKYAEVLAEKLAIQEDELNTLLTQDKDINDNWTIHSYLKNEKDPFNEDGSLKQEVYERIYKQYYDAVKAFDGKSQEGNEEAYEQAKENLEGFTKALDAYYEALNNRDALLQELDDSLGKLNDAAADAADTFQEMLEALADIYETRDEIDSVTRWLKEQGPGEQLWTTELEDAKQALETFFKADYVNQLAKEEASGALDNAGLTADYWQKQVGLFEKHMKPLYEAYTEVSDPVNGGNAAEISKAWNAILEKAAEIGYGENGNPYDEAYLYETAQEAYEAYSEELENGKDKIEELTSAFDTFIETIGDQVERMLDHFDAVSDRLESGLDIVEMLYGEESFGNQNKILEGLVSNIEAKIETIQKGISAQEEILAAVEKAYGKNSEEYQEAEDKLQELEESLLESVSEIQETVNRMYENAVNQEVNTYINGMLGGSYDDDGLLTGMDLDWYGDRWDLITRNAEQYKDDVQKAYELQKLQSKYMDMLDDTNNLLTQEKITDQMRQQMDYLREKTKLSEYDVAYANAQLDILQKTIALEDARANKSQMKLKRDSQGNYNYVYTANEDQVRDAESALLDAQYNAYDLTKNADITSQEGIYDAMTNFKDDLINTLTNMTLSAEEKKNRLQFLIDNFKQYVENASGELKIVGENLLADASNVAELVTQENSESLTAILENTGLTTNEILGQIDDRFNEFIIDRLDDFQNLSDGAKTFETTMRGVLESWSSATKKNLASISKSYDEFTEQHLVPCHAATSSLASTSIDFFDNLNSRIGNVFSNATAIQGYTADLNALNEHYSASISNLQAQLQEKNNEIAEYKAKLNGSSGSGGSGGDGDYGGYSLKDLADGIAGNIWLTGSWGNEPTRSKTMKAKFGAEKGQNLFNAVQANLNNDRNTWGGYYYNWYDYYADPKFSPSAFYSGGYTGSWGDGGLDEKKGKMAILHEKELVLNQTDTQNILSAVGLIRDMTTEMKNSAFGTVLDMIAVYKNIRPEDPRGNSVEQRVSIEAVFPDASDANEIRAALLSLADEAYMYSSKK